MQLQRNNDWHSDRCGKITASRIKDVMSVSKRDGKPLQARQDYLAEIVCEILTGQSVAKFQNAAMAHGVEQEPVALAEYMRQTGADVAQVGFCVHPELEYIGASPDGLMLDCGLEIKCPYSSIVHIKTRLEGMPPEHMAQIQCGMWVCDLPAWDFVSFDPRMPEHLRLYVQRIPRDDAFIADMAKACAEFWDEACNMVLSLTEKAA